MKNTTSRYHPSIVKTTYHIKSAMKVPNFAARWRSIRKYFTHTKPSNQKKTMRGTTAKWRKRYTLILGEQKNQTIQVKAFIILISTSTNNNMHKTNSRSKKNRECLRQLYEAIIPIWWKHLLKTKTTRKEIKPLHSCIITLNEEDPPHQNQEDNSNFRH